MFPSVDPVQIDSIGQVATSMENAIELVMQIDPMAGGANWKPKAPIPTPRRSLERSPILNQSGGGSIGGAADHVTDLRRRVLERLDQEGLTEEITLDLTRTSGNYDEVQFIADGEAIQTEQSTLIEGVTVEGEYDGAGRRLPPPPFEWSGGSTAADIARPKSVETDDGFCPPPRDSILNSAGGGRGGPRDSMMELIHDLNAASSSDGAGAAVAYRNSNGSNRGERATSRYDGFDDDVTTPPAPNNFNGGVIPEERGGGADSDSDDEFTGFGDSFSPPTTTTTTANARGGDGGRQPEFEIPATDMSLRQTVEDLVEDSLRRQGGSTSSRSRHSINSDNDSVSSGVSAEAISHIVAETVNRLMKDKYSMGGGGGAGGGGSGSDLGHRYSGGSDKYLPDSPRNSRSRYSAGSYDSGSASAASQASWSDGGATDPEYIAGDNTMDQLRVKKPLSGKAVARGRIRRLKTGQGEPITGQRILIRRHPQYGFGFAISGNGPTYVHSVDKGGPSDGSASGNCGLLVGDVILKIGQTPCANIPRADVIKLIQEVRGEGALGLVVARTPEARRRAGGGGGGGGVPGAGSPLRNSNGAGNNSSAEHPGSGRSSPTKPQRAMSGGSGGRLLDSPNRPNMRSISDHLGFEKSSFKDGVSVRSGESGGSGGSGSNGGGGARGSSNLSSGGGHPDNLSGWLAVLARRANGPSWKRCWVELDRDRLSHHESHGSSPLGALGVARSMSSAVNQRDRGAVDVDGHGAFKVVQPGKEPHYFKAATEAEMYMWIKSLTAASKRYR